MTIKSKILIAGIALIVAFIGGRFSASRPDVKTVTQTDETKKTDEIKDTHIVTVIKEITKPSGEVEKTTTIDTNITKRTETEATKDTKTVQTETSSNNKVTIQALVGYDMAKQLPTYGASAAKDIAGPISVGAWGLSNGSIGVSLGVRF
jgi:hypothetical protein